MSLLGEQMDKYLAKGKIGFHSPAHGGRANPRDLTELSGLDNLQYPAGVIKESQDFVADLFGAAKSFFLVNGASVGMHAALLALSMVRKPLLISRNVHKSVVSGLILSGLDVHWFEPEWVSEASIFGRFTEKNFPGSIEEINENYSALIITNPSYEGFYSDLKFIPQLEIPVIVDEAHGAHYRFSDQCPKPALQMGADIVVQSWHKTLGSLTQTGVLHVNRYSKIKAELIENNLRILQSTSPSYLLLESICQTAERLAESGNEIFTKTIELTRNINFAHFANDDPTKILFQINQFLAVPGSTPAAIPGPILESILFEEYGIALEAHTASSGLAFINYSNTHEDIEKLNRAYENITYSYSRLARNSGILNQPRFGTQLMSPRQAFYKQYASVSLEEAIGQVSHELYAPCPPGIPLLVPGQVITESNINIIKFANKFTDLISKKLNLEVIS